MPTITGLGYDRGSRRWTRASRREGGQHGPCRKLPESSSAGTGCLELSAPFATKMSFLEEDFCGTGSSARGSRAQLCPTWGGRRLVLPLARGAPLGLAIVVYPQCRSSWWVPGSTRIAGSAARWAPGEAAPLRAGSSLAGRNPWNPSPPSFADEKWNQRPALLGNGGRMGSAEPSG